MFGRKKVWDLSTVKYVSERVATQADGKAGCAAFIAPPGVTKPSKITIPQYAYYIGPDAPKTPVIIIQAEEMIDGRATVVGFIDLSQEVGLPVLEFNACKLDELELLGDIASRKLLLN